MRIIEINYFEGGRWTNPDFKRYNDFWADDLNVGEIEKVDKPGGVPRKASNY